jgi:hypothetical protein
VRGAAGGGLAPYQVNALRRLLAKATKQVAICAQGSTHRPPPQLNQVRTSCTRPPPPIPLPRPALLTLPTHSTPTLPLLLSSLLPPVLLFPLPRRAGSGL